jgi:hypothetical protein
MSNADTCVQIIKELTPLISVVVVGMTSWLPSFLTNRANRKLAEYSRKKDEVDFFSKACGKQ